MWTAQACACFGSDYLFAHKWSLAHAIDRTMAPSTGLYIMLWATASIGPLALLGLVCPLFCFWNSKQCINASDWNGYVFWHVMWHAACGVMLTVSYHVVGSVSNNGAIET